MYARAHTHTHTHACMHACMHVYMATDSMMHQGVAKIACMHAASNVVLNVHHIYVHVRMPVIYAHRQICVCVCVCVCCYAAYVCI